MGKRVARTILAIVSKGELSVVRGDGRWGECTAILGKGH